MQFSKILYFFSLIFFVLLIWVSMQNHAITVITLPLNQDQATAFELKHTMEAPVFIYYQFDEFFQNNNQYNHSQHSE